jgi:hypothetical protein
VAGDQKEKNLLSSYCYPLCSANAKGRQQADKPIVKRIPPAKHSYTLLQRLRDHNKHLTVTKMTKNLKN